MRAEKDRQAFTFWKHSWGKWVLLLAVILQAISLFLLVQEYREYEGLYQQGRVFSQTLWENYSAQTRFQLALRGMFLIGCLDVFLMGFLIRSKQGLRLAETVSLFLLTAAWGIAGPALQLTTVPSHRTIWILFLLILAVACCWSGIQYRWNAAKP